MFFQRRKLLDSMTGKLIIANVAVFVLIWILKGFLSAEVVNSIFTLTPGIIMDGGNLWTLITSMFSHFSFVHLFFNMFSLYFIGSFLENLIGGKRVLKIYLLSGLFAGIFWSFLSDSFGAGILGVGIFGSPVIGGLGASGALFGLLGVLSILTPRKKVYLLSGPLIAIVFQYLFYGLFYKNSILINVVSILVNIYIFIMIFSMFSFNQKRRKLAIPIEMSFKLLPLVAIIPLTIVSVLIGYGFNLTLPIGNMAHLGGLIFGLIYASFLKLKFPRKTGYLSRRVK